MPTSISTSTSSHSVIALFTRVISSAVKKISQFLNFLFCVRNTPNIYQSNIKKERSFSSLNNEFSSSITAITPNLNSAENDKTVHALQQQTATAKVDRKKTSLQGDIDSEKLPKNYQLENIPISSLEFAPSPEGELLGEGASGKVRIDLEHEGFVVKSLRTDGFMYDEARELRKLHEECELFNKFYGEGSAEVFDKGGKTFLRMLRVPGIPLTKCKPLPVNSRKLFLNMIAHLADCGIMHDDLHFDNIMYDAKSDRFWPIDLSDKYEKYHSDPAYREHTDNLSLEWFAEIMDS